MEKGKYGVKLCFYTVVAFVLAYLGQATLLFLVAGIVLIGEKNEWAVRQVIQAVCLCFVRNIVSSLVGLFDFIDHIPFAGAIWDAAIGLVSSAVSVVVLVFCVVGIIRNVKGEDANVPVAGSIAGWAYGIVKDKTQSQTAGQ